VNTLVPSIGPSGGREAVSDMFTLGDWGKLLKRRQKIIYICLSVFLVLATIKCITAKRLYQANGEIQVQRESSGDFGLGNGVMANGAAGADSLDYNLTLQTQAQILLSDTLALQVIKDMNLESNFFYAKSQKSFSLIPSFVFFWRKPLEPLSVPIDNAPNRRAASLATFAGLLKVKPVPGTRLVDISFLAPSPAMASDVVNHLISAFTQYTFQTRFAATQQGSAWLTGQLSQLKKDAEDAQTRAVKLQRETGMFGDDEQHNVVLARLQSLNDSLTSDTSNRILKQAIFEAAKNGDPELISNLGGNSTAATGGSPNSFSLLQNLRTQESTIKAQVAQDKVKYGDNFPKLISEKAELQNIENAIQSEINRIAGRARSDYEIAARTENQARNVFDQQKQLANELNDKAIAYSLAKQEADESRNLYEGLLGKLKQAGVLEGLKSSNISIVKAAVIPPTNKPKKPNIPLYYAAAIAGGLFFGIVAAIAVDLSDNTFHSLAEIEQFLGLPMLGILPHFERGGGTKKALGSRSNRRGLAVKDPDSVGGGLVIQAASQPDSVFVESLRTLRTSLLLSRGTPPKVILITSSLPGEGKSTLSLNLAGVFAQQGGRVLLVDADLRTSTLQRRLGFNEKQGLSSALSSESVTPTPRKLEQIPNLSVLFGGSIPPFPSELLGSKRMHELLAKWRNEYDFIFIDSPPVLPVTDAIILSQIADATLLVVRHAVTEKQPTQRSFRALSRQMPSDAILGVVLNAVSRDSAEDYGYYGYHSYEYSSKGTGTYGTVE
jgi:polysaccharide biosynthesis transport protein